MTSPILPTIALLISVTIFSLGAALPARPAHPEGIPDLTKVEGPAIAEAAKKDWFLQLGGARGWAYRNNQGKCDDARQILITKVPKDTTLNQYLNEILKVGDVILGVNGKYFSKHPIFEFRETAGPTGKQRGTFDIILWRKGWEKGKAVTLDLRFRTINFTKGGKPDDTEDMNLGPTGARGWMEGLNRHSYIARQILITSVAKGSPVDGILKKGDVILGIDKTKFDSDARKLFGEAITAAETEEGQGNLRLLCWRPDDPDVSTSGTTETVAIKLPVLGSYSETTPWDCKKSDALLKNACAYMTSRKIISRGNPLMIPNLMGALALMSTGEEEHMRLAKEHVYKVIKLTEESGEYPPKWVFAGWSWGYTNLLLTEYYLLTKDPNALPAIKKYSTKLARGQAEVGTWGHNMATDDGYCNGYGAMNQCGNICLMSLILAQNCGFDDPEIDRAVKRGKAYLNQFVGLEPVPYGDGVRIDWPAHDDNGKCSTAAVVNAIAGDKDATTFYSKMSVASFEVREPGHTGSWWSNVWGPMGTRSAGKKGCSAFLQQMAWRHDLERRWNGGFVFPGQMNTTRAWNRNYNWDTTGARILMYTLPRKRLYITGRDSLTDLVPDEDVAGLIEDGCRPPVDTDKHENKYDHLSEQELLEKLNSWSPVVRYCASLSIGKKDKVSVDKLAEMVSGDNVHGRYGACAAIMQLKERGAPALDALLNCLSSDDPILLIHAVRALGAIGDKRAVEPLLKMAGSDITNDDRGIVRRFVTRALFLKKGAFSKTDGLLVNSLADVDRSLLYPAASRILQCNSGFERGCVSSAVLKKLSFEELAPLWPAMIPALRECSKTNIMFASTVRQDIAQILADNKVEEGMPLLVEYFNVQKGHGSPKRSEFIAEQLKKYGASAKPILPELEACIKYLKLPREHINKGQPGPGDMYKTRGPAVESVIKSIKESKETPTLVSIRPYLQELSKPQKRSGE